MIIVFALFHCVQRLFDVVVEVFECRPQILQIVLHLQDAHLVHGKEDIEQATGDGQTAVFDEDDECDIVIVADVAYVDYVRNAAGVGAIDVALQKDEPRIDFAIVCCGGGGTLRWQLLLAIDLQEYEIGGGQLLRLAAGAQRK